MMGVFIVRVYDEAQQRSLLIASHLEEEEATRMRDAIEQAFRFAGVADSVKVELER